MKTSCSVFFTRYLHSTQALRVHGERLDIDCGVLGITQTKVYYIDIFKNYDHANTNGQ